MTGYKSKKDAAQDKLAHMTFEQRCRLSEQCLPDAPYREMLTKLHNEMLVALAQSDLHDYAVQVFAAHGADLTTIHTCTPPQEKNT